MSIDPSKARNRKAVLARVATDVQCASTAFDVFASFIEMLTSIFAAYPDYRFDGTLATDMRELQQTLPGDPSSWNKSQTFRMNIAQTTWDQCIDSMRLLDRSMVLKRALKQLMSGSLYFFRTAWIHPRR